MKDKVLGTLILIAIIVVLSCFAYTVVLIKGKIPELADIFKPKEASGSVIEYTITPVPPTLEQKITDHIISINKEIPNNEAREIALELSHRKDWALIMAIIEQESNYDRYAVSKAGCVGLMQVHPPSHVKRLKNSKIIKSHRDLFNIKSNIKAGVNIYRMYRAQRSTIGALGKYSNDKTNKYAEEVISRWEMLEKKIGG